MGVFFVKKVDLSSTQGALRTESVFFYFTFYLCGGGCVRTRRTLPTGLTMQQHNKSIDNARAVTGGPNLRLRYVNKMDDTL